MTRIPFISILLIALITTSVSLYSSQLNVVAQQTIDLNASDLSPEIISAIQIEMDRHREEIDIQIENRFFEQESNLISSLNEKVEDELSSRDIPSQHFDMVKHIFDETRNSFNTLIWAITILTTVAAVVIAMTLGGSVRDVKQVKDSVGSEIDGAKQLQKDLAEELQKIKNMEREIQEKDRSVNELLEIRKSLREKIILWIFERENENDQEMVRDLRENNFKNILMFHINEVRAPRSESRWGNGCDCVVYSMSEMSTLETLESIISRLTSMPRKPPLLIYTYNSSGKSFKISDEQMNELNQYRNYSISTTPGNFKSTFNGLILGIVI